MSAFGLIYCSVGINVVRVTDPFLLSGYDDLAASAPVDRIAALARRMNVPRSSLAGTDLDMIERLERICDRSEADEAVWGGLVAQLARELTAAGFMRHNPMGHRGGYCLSIWDDGVIVNWSTTEYEDDTVGPFEVMVERIMRPALLEILHATGFSAHIVPEGQDNAGWILVTGRPESPFSG